MQEGMLQYFNHLYEFSTKRHNFIPWGSESCGKYKTLAHILKENPCVFHVTQPDKLAGCTGPVYDKGIVNSENHEHLWPYWHVMKAILHTPLMTDNYLRPVLSTAEKFSANERRCHLCGIYSHWLRPCSDTELKLWQWNKGQIIISSLHIGELQYQLTGRWECGSKSKSIISKLIIKDSSLDTCSVMTLRWMPKSLMNDMSILIQVMAWCHQATGH